MVIVYSKLWFVQVFINGLDVYYMTMTLTQTRLLTMQVYRLKKCAILAGIRKIMRKISFP